MFQGALRDRKGASGGLRDISGGPCYSKGVPVGLRGVSGGFEGSQGISGGIKRSQERLRELHRRLKGSESQGCFRGSWRRSGGFEGHFLGSQGHSSGSH